MAIGHESWFMTIFHESLTSDQLIGQLIWKKFNKEIEQGEDGAIVRFSLSSIFKKSILKSVSSKKTGPKL